MLLFEFCLVGLVFFGPMLVLSGICLLLEKLLGERRIEAIDRRLGGTSYGRGHHHPDVQRGGEYYSKRPRGGMAAVVEPQERKIG